MWGWLFLALFVVGAAMTYVGVVVHQTPRSDDRMIVFPSAVAELCWLWLALTPELVLATDGGMQTIEVGSASWLFAALALLVGIWLVGVVVGIFPGRRAEDEIEKAALTNHQ